MRLDEDTGDTPILTMLAQEVHVLSNLSSPNIIRVIGFVEDIENGIAWIVLPWEKNGNLHEFIQSAKWELPERISLIYDVSSGINYLHCGEPPICHGDLKSVRQPVILELTQLMPSKQLNVLVSAENRAVLTDLGSARSQVPSVEKRALPISLSRRIETAEDPRLSTLRADVVASGESMTLSGPAWTLRWAAPELLDGFYPTLASDIWALGWICWEVLTGNLPFHEESDTSAIHRILEGRLPLVLGDVRLNQVTALANLMNDCWLLHPSKRPTATKCVRQIYWMDHTRPCIRNANESFEAGSPWVFFSLACMYLTQDKLSDAEVQARRSMEAACSRRDHKALATAVRALGVVYRRRGESFKAERSFVCAQYILSRIGDQSGLAYTMRALSEVYYRRGEYGKAKELSVNALNLFARIGDKSGFAWAATVLADVYSQQGEWSKAKEFHDTTRNIFSRIENQLGLMEALNSLGGIYRLRGEYAKAEESYSVARDISARIGKETGTANALIGLADVYLLRGDNSKAQKLYTAARDIYIQCGDRHGLAAALNGLGDVYLEQAKYDQAEESYIATRDIYAGFGEPCGIAKALKALGDVNRLREKYPEAEDCYLTSRDICSRIKNRLGLANASTGQGQLHFERKDYAEAENSFRESREIYSKLGDKFSLATNLWYTGLLCQAQSFDEEAERLASESLNLYRELGLEKYASRCDRLLEGLRRETRE